MVEVEIPLNADKYDLVNKLKAHRLPGVLTNIENANITQQARMIAN